MPCWRPAHFRKKLMRTITLPVKGMNFATCVRAIEKHLGGRAPIAEVDASYVSQTVTITYDEQRIGEGELRQLVADCGFACGEAQTAAELLRAASARTAAAQAHGHDGHDGHDGHTALS